MKARWLILAFVMGTVAAIGVPVLFFQWMFSPAPRTPAPDWRATYDHLRAQGKSDQAFMLLDAVASAREPAGYRLLADEIDARIYPSDTWHGSTDAIREAARNLANVQPHDGEISSAWNGFQRARAHFEDSRAYGLAFALRDTWLWQRCDNRFTSLKPDTDRLWRAVDEAEGRAHRSSRRERAMQRCSDDMLTHALALERGAYGKATQSLATEWLRSASGFALPERHEADVAYAIRVLDGRIAVPDSENPERERRMAEFSLISAAWDGYGPAQVAAAKLLLDGRMSDFALRTKHGPAGEAYALLRLAESAGADAGPALEAAKARLSPEAREALDAEITAVQEARPAGANSER